MDHHSRTADYFRGHLCAGARTLATEQAVRRPANEDPFPLAGFIGVRGLRVFGAPGQRPHDTASQEMALLYRCSRSQHRQTGSQTLCSNRAVRQDYLDEMVWNQVIQLLENPELIRAEIARRV